MTRHKFKLGLQIFLLIASVFAFAYILHESSYGNAVLIIEKKNINWKILVKILLGIIFNEKTLVSALEADDLQKGVSTCVKGKDGSLCQEYASSECAAKCAGECLPSKRDNVPSCKLGTCFDSDSGICQERATKNECELKGGKWFDDPAGNVAECQKACCVVGDEVAPLITSRECTKIGEIRGITTNYKPEVKNELACLALGRTKVEGACVFENPEEKRCRFLTKVECIGNSGQFYEGLLCTNSDLGMNYKKQASARCVEGKDEIYWFDSEGNRENIYDANKVKSWNNGNILSDEKTCEVGDSSNSLKNQKTCGNCNRLFGSVCGQKTSSEKLSDNSIDAVCRDMRCVDKNGNKRENGESWCEYQGAIGTDKGAAGFKRSVDTPGSTHFRATCVDGEVEINPCANYRNEVCAEERNKRTDGEEISSSACITNLWQLCLNYNAEVKGTGVELQESVDKRNEKCVKNPLCILKKVDAADSFKFDLCAPKYAPGFDLKKNAEGGELACAFANQKCTVVFVKGLDGWDAKVNKGCLKEGFAQQMNDLCMSLGDCGASVNYNGDLTKNYKVINTPRLSEAYLKGIKEYSKPVKNQYAKINVTEYINAVGGIEKLGGKFDDPAPDLQFAGGVSGATGSVLTLAISKGLFSGGAPASTSSAAGLAGVLAGAAIGFAVTSLLLQYTGVAAGLDPAITWTLVVAGTVAGAMLGASVTGFAGASFTGTFALGLSALALFGIVLILVVIIVIVIFAALGIGDTKKKVVTFSCQPWQPPLGGKKCSECGKDGYKCSKYSCQALGQSCEFINEGTGKEECVDINPGDVSAPVIRPFGDALTKGYKYEEVSDSGVKVVSEQNDGCIGSYTNLFFGINLNEPGYCRYNAKHTNNFDDMENDEGADFGNRNLFLYNHSQFFTLPDLASLGLPGYDPNRKADLNLYVRCIDSKGNGKDGKEYAINFCVKPGVDTTPPIITAREPFNEFVKFNAAKIDASVFVNEPAECNWDFDKNKKYDEMNNKMECFNDIQDRESIFGWKCNTIFNIDKNEESFYIKCKDQPWNAGNESKRNVMISPYEFKLKKTATPLVINSVKPNNETLVFGVEPATVTLEVQTSGGVDDRAVCSIFGANMGETFGTVHKQKLDQILKGKYEFPIMCEDSVGNKAEITSTFNADLDNDPPIVSRVYNLDRSLVVVTNENSECSFVKSLGRKESCNFDFINGTLMSGTLVKLHTTNFESGSYYIKCKDKWGYVPGECSVIVKSG